MKLLLRYLRRYRHLVFLALLLATMDQLFINLNPYIIGTRLIDPFASKARYFREHGLEADYVRGVFSGILMIVVVSTMAWLSKGFQSFTVNKIVRRLGADLYSDVQSHVLCLPYRDFEDQRSGEILSILQRARTDSETFINKFVNVLFVSIIGLGFVVFISFRLSPLLPVLYVTGAVVLSVITNFLSRKIKAIQKGIMAETNALAGSTTESLRNIELLKSLGLIQQEIRRLNKANFRILKNELKKIKNIRSIGFVYSAFIQTLHQVFTFSLLLFVFYDKLTVGQLMMMQLYFYFIFGYLGELNLVIVAYREAEISLTNLQQLLDMPKDTVCRHPEKIGPITHLRFENIRFQHRSAIRPALESISLEIKLGETVAIVGPSGSGKTTLVKLLVGLYSPTSGNIYYNGCMHDRIDYDEMRHQLGLVTQDTQLFSGTIKENLLFLDPAADDDTIGEVLRRTACQNLLDRAPKGVDSVIGEGGLKLSGGERQRLSIARSLVRRSRLIIFDEATSSLDSLTEREITDTIRSITQQKEYITLMIAHRLSTVMFADRIYVLDKGRIVETGNHRSLLEKKGLYNAMWREQTGEWKESVIVPPGKIPVNEQ
ncbi:ABC transporter ATP-binding protein [Flavitalea sp. BT771]|uniref:ABC transporter ATP-binding protein n=1 Tax=Flavitalea sp. BT771 TaxID=3063329 RepID=UPI0026E2C68A|nr:ABC transporter ATP-binding protein [Flavitalea sp. BT771]MDO6431644.1 ABC transporter ATP-binding protein [Flavitalea sp. BT771]MDV6220552.1 ABC transporter ATP-binding protein [Flavitalea sp. BT771]